MFSATLTFILKGKTTQAGENNFEEEIGEEPSFKTSTVRAAKAEVLAEMQTQMMEQNGERETDPHRITH